MAGLDPAIHVTSAATVRTEEGVDHRDKPGDDDHYESRCQHAATDFDEPDSRATWHKLFVIKSRGASVTRGAIAGQTLSSLAPPGVPIIVSTSRRLDGSSRKAPSIRLVTIVTPGLCTPRVVMHWWAASMTTATPLGCSTSSSVLAICAVIFS